MWRGDGRTPWAGCPASSGESVKETCPKRARVESSWGGFSRSTSTYRKTLTKNKTKWSKQKLPLETWSLKCSFHPPPRPSGFEYCHALFLFFGHVLRPWRNPFPCHFHGSLHWLQLRFSVWVIREAIVTYRSWFNCFYPHTSPSSSLLLVKAKNSIPKVPLIIFLHNTTSVLIGETRKQVLQTFS